MATTNMEGFCGPDGKLWAYYFYNPLDPRPSLAEAVGFSNYYYSQTRPNGSRDNNNFEDLWGAIETVWPETMRAIRADACR